MRAGLVDERDVQGLIEMETACGLPQTNNDAERVCAEKRKGKEEKWACEACHRYPEQVKEMVETGQKLLWCSAWSVNDSPSKSRLVLYPK